MKSIMPPGYSKAATRKRLIEELTKHREQELAHASPVEQRRIRQHIKHDVETKLIELYGKSTAPRGVLWH